MTSSFSQERTFFIPSTQKDTAMAETAPSGETLCPVALTLNLIGGKWKALILWNLLEGAMRYSALRRAVPDATPKMLTQQLRELEADGLVTRTVWPSCRPRSSMRSRRRARASSRFLRPCTGGATPIWPGGTKELLLDEAARRRMTRGTDLFRPQKSPPAFDARRASGSLISSSE